MLADILALGSLVIRAGSALASHAAHKKAADANVVNADAALKNDIGALSLRQTQEQAASNLTIQQIDRAARQKDALARVAAGESGVAGASVDALLSDLNIDQLTAKQTEQTNLDMQLAQLEQEKQGALTMRQNRVNAVPRPNPLLPALTIAGASLDTLTTLNMRKPT